MAEQLQRSGYDTRDDVKESRLAAYFNTNPDSSFDPQADPVTPTDFQNFVFNPENSFAPGYGFITTQTPYGPDSSPPGGGSWNAELNQWSNDSGPVTDLQSITTYNPYPKIDPKTAQYHYADFYEEGINSPEWQRLQQYSNLDPVWDFYKNNPSRFGEYIARWNGRYSPLQFAAGVDAPGLESYGKYFKEMESPEAQSSRNVNSWLDFVQGFGDIVHQFDPIDDWVSKNVAKAVGFEGPYAQAQLASIIVPAIVGGFAGGFGGAGSAAGAGEFSVAPVGAAEAATLAGEGLTAAEIAQLGSGAQMLGGTASAAGSLSSYLNSNTATTLKDIYKSASAANSIKNEDYLGALRGLTGLSGVGGYVSPEMLTAVKGGLGLAKGIEGKNPISAISGLSNLYGGMSKYNTNNGGGNKMAWDDELFGPSYELSNDFAGPPSGLQNMFQSGGSDEFFGPPDYLFKDNYNYQNNQMMGPPSDMSNDFMGPPGGLQNRGFDFNSMGGKGLDFLNKNMNTIGGLAGIYQKNQQAKQMQGLMDQMRGSMDPFGGQRPQYQAQLAQTYTNPSLYLNSPEYKAIEDRMRSELERKDAAGGRRSQYGNRALDLQQNALANLYKQREQLGGFAGAGIQPQSGMAQAVMGAQGGINTSNAGMLGDLAKIFNDNRQKKSPMLDLSMFGGGVY